jgi:hypothetical protein
MSGVIKAFAHAVDPCREEDGTPSSAERLAEPIVDMLVEGLEYTWQMAFLWVGVRVLLSGLLAFLHPLGYLYGRFGLWDSAHATSYWLEWGMLFPLTALVLYGLGKLLLRFLGRLFIEGFTRFADEED